MSCHDAASTHTELDARLFALSLPPQSPVPTQDPIGCSPTRSASSPHQSFIVNYHFETVERAVSRLTVSTIGQYNLLSFNMGLANTDPDMDGNHLGIAPHSYPNVAAFSANTNLFNLTGPAAITADHLESTVSYFHPQSWWYGCVFATEESAGSLPTNRDIMATGFDSSGKQAASQTFHFRANGSQVMFQNYAAFSPSFHQSNIYRMELSVTNSLITAALIDDFVATLYQPACAPMY